jgi:DeoR/GlpR family transcriptional regulator of sugar metabolism
MADSSKFNAIGSVKLCDLQDIDVLITDRNIPEEYVRLCNDLGVQLMITEN